MRARLSKFQQHQSEGRRPEFSWFSLFPDSAKSEWRSRGWLELANDVTDRAIDSFMNSDNLIVDNILQLTYDLKIATNLGQNINTSAAQWTEKLVGQFRF